MRLLYLLVFLTLAGCRFQSTEEQEEARTDFPDPSHFVCSAAQLELVAREVEICAATGYFSSYCFRQAKATQCDEMNPEGEPLADLEE